MHLNTILFLTLITAGLTYSLWTIFNSKQAISNRQNSRKRKSDRIKLSKTDKKIYRNAFEQYKKKNYKACAQLLESINYQREAINILEKHNQVHEAANMLMRMQLPNRAGYIYARNSFWKEAAECFKLANLPSEVAVASKKAGDLATAVAYHLQAEDYHEAADINAELGRHKEAAELYARINDHTRAIEEYNKLIASNPDLDDLKFSDIELKIISNYLIKGKAREELADILAQEDQLLDTIIALVREGNIEFATSIYKRTAKNLGAEIISLETLEDSDNKLLAQLLTEAGSFGYAAILFERLGSFEKAGDAFKFDQDYGRAAEAYDRANQKEKATEMRILFAQNGPKPKAPVVHDVPDNISPVQKNNDELVIELSESYTGPSTNNASANSSSISTNENTSNNSHRDDSAKAHGFSIQIPTESGIFSNKSSDDTSIISVKDIPDPLMAVKEVATEKSNQSSKSDGLNWNSFYSSNFFIDLSREQINLLKDIAIPAEFDENELILEYGQEPIGIYFVLSGEVKIYKYNETTATDTIRESQTFGELWLLIDKPSDVQFVSGTKSVIVTIKRADFNELLDKHGSIARLLYKRFTLTLAEKLLTDRNHESKTIAS